MNPLRFGPLPVFAPEGPAPSPAPSPSPAPAPSPTPAPADWTAGLADDDKSLVTTKGWKQPGEAIASYRQLEKMIGAEKLVLPGKDAKPEDWEKWDGWGKLGRPEKADGYELKAPDGWKHGYDGERAKRVAERAHKAGITKAQLAILHAGELEDADKFFTTMASQQAAAAQAIEAEATQKWGAAKQEKMRLSVAGAKHLGFSQEDFGALPFAVRDKLATLAEQLKIGEDGLIAGDGPQRGTMTPAEAKAEIERLSTDKDSGYYDADHPKHRATVARVFELRQLAFPEPEKAA